MQNADEIISVVVSGVESPDKESGGMSNRSFREVAISLSAPPIREEEHGNSVPEKINTLTKSKSVLIPRPWSFISRVRSMPKISSRNQSGSARSSLSDATYQDFDSDSAEHESPSRAHLFAHRMSLTPSQISLAAIGKPLSQLRKVITSVSKNRPRSATQSPERPASTEKIKISFVKRIDNWANVLQCAIQEDVRGNFREAHGAYKRFNIQVTKEAIHNFDQFTCDQQKLLNRMMSLLDRRCHMLLHKINEEYDIKDPKVEKLLQEDTSLSDLHQCLSILSTVKTIGSKKKIPVVLVYQEKKHRKKHRDEGKGKSNKIIFPKEKRDFLQMLGLPGNMVTDQGLDFSVMPDEDETKAPTDKEYTAYKEQSIDSFHTAQQRTPEVPKEVEANMSNSHMDNAELKVPKKEESKSSLVDKCLGLRKNSNDSSQKYNLSDSENQRSIQTFVPEDEIESDLIKAVQSESASMLSCDSCSSSESIDSTFSTETDTAVFSSYVHRETLLPKPFLQDSETCVSIKFDKVGLKKTTIISPFLRISIREKNGFLVGEEQETLAWDVISKHYLTAPSSEIYLQQILQSISPDMAVFFEVRQHIPSKRKIGTHSYTFLEKEEIQSGEFICEMYKPPVDFTRGKLIPYSEKAFFLHMQIIFEDNEIPEDNEGNENHEDKEDNENHEDNEDKEDNENHEDNEDNENHEDNKVNEI